MDGGALLKHINVLCKNELPIWTTERLRLVNLKHSIHTNVIEVICQG